jgi:hypothetical protein
VQAVVTIYIKEFDQLGRHNGYSQGSERTGILTIAPRCQPVVACDYFEDRVRAWRAQGRPWEWIRRQREYAIWRRLGGG